MSHSQFHSIDRLYLDMHGLIFETSVCYWQNQPGYYQYTISFNVDRQHPKTLSTMGQNSIDYCIVTQ